ncbi:general secretion pathway protein GspK [Persephonella sp.]
MILIVVIILIGSLGGIVLNLTEDRYIFENYIKNKIETEEIFLISDSASEAVIKLLDSDDKNIDYIGEFWSQTLPVDIGKGKVIIEIADQERYLNPNYLIKGKNLDQKMYNIFERLFTILEINPKILNNIIDWIDPDSFSSGGEEEYQLFKAKNSKLDTLDELRLIKGIDDHIFNGTIKNGEFKPGLRSVISPYSNGKVNINTASKWVLMSLDQDIDESLASNILSYRAEKPFKRVDDLINVDGMNSDILYRIKPYIDVKSQNFLANIELIIGDRKYKLVILLNRSAKTKVIWKKLY